MDPGVSFLSSLGYYLLINNSDIDLLVLGPPQPLMANHFVRWGGELE
jgi:hypothetical protein